MNKDSLLKYLEASKNIIDRELDKFLPKEKEYPVSIHKAMRYSLFAGGKRIRPVLTLSVAKVLGKDYRKIVPAACAIEMIHTYSRFLEKQ